MTHGKKILALLMAIMLLVSMAPTSLAYAGYCPDGQHQWGPKQYGDDHPTCVNPASWWRICTVCGEGSDGEETGPHSWGPWATVRQATCVEVGLEQRTCSYCGATESRTFGGGGHQFGPWRLTAEPTCIGYGREEQTCSLCDYTQWRSLEMIDHTFGPWFVAIEPQVGVPGLERRVCTFCALEEEREIPALEPGFVFVPGGTPAPAQVVEPAPGGVVVDPDTVIVNPTPDTGVNGNNNPDWNNGQFIPGGEDDPAGAVQLPTVVLEKHVMNTPANGEFFVPGETIEFGFTLWVYGPGQTKASSEFIVNQATIFDPLKENPIVLADMGGTWNMGNAFFYTVTEEDAQRGYVENTGYATWVYVENGQPGRIDSNTVTTPCGEDKLEIEGELALTLALSSTPANGTHFVVGEEVTFTETWANNTNQTLYPFAVSIFTCAAPAYGSEIDQICSWDAEGTGPVAPGASGSHSLTVTVTEADVARGAIYATAEIRATVHKGADLDDVIAPYVTAPCGPDNSGDFGLVNGLTVTKKVTSTPANGSFYVPGETVTYEVCVKNNGEPLNMLCVSDWMRDGTFKYGTIETGEDVNYPISYTVIELDAISGSVCNISFAEAVAANGDPVLEYSNSVTVPCGFPAGDDPFGIFHSLAVVKKEESLPLNGQYYTEGEVIHYTITYTNDGELPLTDVQVWDTLDINTTIGHAEMLQPGESRVCYYQHTVTAEDVEAGGVLNMAQANYPIPGGEGYIGVNSNLVFSKTSVDGIHCVVLPLFPEDGEDPEYDPGTGWFPSDDPIIEGDTPPFGTIDTDKLKGGDAYCVRTITGKDSASASYEISFCADHVDAQSSALLMNQAAAAPEMKLQAASYAVALWRAEVETLYQEILDAADSAAKATVMTEYIRFLTELANYEAMLNLLYPDQPALVAQMIAAKWEDKCVTLCYEIHAPAAERKDSLLNVTAATDAEATICSCEITAEENGKKAYTQNLCAAHSFPFSMIDALLKGQDTAEAWAMVRQIWGVELSSAYNKLSDKLGENSTLAAAEYNALTLWMAAREASLIALYPENPELVAQTMVKIIMDRVNELCAALQ